ncbi:DUF5565 family protein [Flavobacterium collinsii]|uniref:RNA ligase 1 family protein n=1 Tax=Flavobacterium collinsii TaxID=1114861 RepID=UPI003757CE0C
MKKIGTLFAKDPTDLAKVINKIGDENKWVITGEAIATRKFDGSAAAIINGELFKRFDAKKGCVIPFGAIACQEADTITGHHPHWLKCDRSKSEDRFFFEGFDNLKIKTDGTFELCGPKVQGNPEKLEKHTLIKHGSEVFDFPNPNPNFEFEDLKNFLSEYDIEGIVFHHVSDGRMCKVRKSDFGIKRLELVEEAKLYNLNNSSK